jgi:hypothetical protein
VLVGKSTKIKGPVHFSDIIARAPVSYEKKPTLPPWSSDAEAWQKKRESWGDYYRDAAVVAYPTDINTNKPIPSDKMIDLTRQMDADGRLIWDVPEDNWTVVRLGCAAFNGPNYPTSIEGAGLEVDRMDPKAAKLVLDNYVGRLAREARAKGYKSFKDFDTDSYEAGRQDFSEDFIAQFKKRMGYDCTAWLAEVVTGRGRPNPDWHARLARRGRGLFGRINQIGNIAVRRRGPVNSGLLESLKVRSLDALAGLGLNHFAIRAYPSEGEREFLRFQTAPDVRQIEAGRFRMNHPLLVALLH